MLQVRLIDLAEIRKYKQLSQNPNNDKLNECIGDAQLIDVMPQLGETLFRKICATPNSYTDLLNGQTYTFNNESYTHDGIKAALCYFAYARYKMFGNDINTTFGNATKLAQNVSEPTNEQTLRSVYKQNQQAAQLILDGVLLYLDRTNNPDYEKNFCKESRRISQLRISKLDNKREGTYYDYHTKFRKPTI